MRIYVGNLSYGTDEQRLESVFAAFGPVKNCSIMRDRETGQSRGFGFVEMDDEAGQTAINALNGTQVDGRTLTVNEARPQAPRTGGGSRGGYERSSGGGGRREYGGGGRGEGGGKRW